MTRELNVSRCLDYIIYLSKSSYIHIGQNSVGFRSAVYLGLFLYLGIYTVGRPDVEDRMSALCVDAQTTPNLKH